MDLYKHYNSKSRALDVKINLIIDYRNIFLNLLIVIGIMAAALTLSIWQAGNTVLAKNVFPSGTLVNGYDIGGLSYEEGMELILARYRDELDDYNVLLNYDDYSITLGAQELGIVNCIENLLYNASYSTPEDEPLSGVSTIIRPKSGQSIDITPILDVKLVEKTLQDALFPGQDAHMTDNYSISLPITNTTSSVDDMGNVTIYLTVNVEVLNGYVAELTENEREQEEQEIIRTYNTKELIQYRKLIEEYAEKHELDPAYVTAVIFVESAFIPTSESPAGAIGLMQILPSTGLWIAGQMGMSEYKIEMLFDPETNIHIGCWYLSYLLDLFDGNVHSATVAYNAGPVRVLEWLRDERYSADGKNLDMIPFEETKAHTDQIEAYHEIYKSIFKA